MINKISSKRAASIAGRVLDGKDYSTRDVKTLAASVLAQRIPGKPKQSVASKRPKA